MSEELRALMRQDADASAFLFALFGSVSPRFHAVLPDGNNLLLDASSISDKDTMAEAARNAFEQHNVVRYCFFDEAWTLETRDMSEAEAAELEALIRRGKYGIENHPHRREVVMFSGEERGGLFLTAHRDIIRPSGLKARLGPLVFSPPMNSEGRLVGLLTRSKESLQ